jgi:hypothetical protein
MAANFFLRPMAERAGDGSGSLVSPLMGSQRID